MDLEETSMAKVKDFHSGEIVYVVFMLPEGDFNIVCKARIISVIGSTKAARLWINWRIKPISREHVYYYLKIDPLESESKSELRIAAAYLFKQSDTHGAIRALFTKNKSLEKL